MYFFTVQLPEQHLFVILMYFTQYIYLRWTSVPPSLEYLLLPIHSLQKASSPRHTTCGLTPTRRNLPILYRQTLQTYNSLMATKPNRYIDSDILALPFSVSSHCFVTRCPTTCRASDCPYIQITLSTLCQCFLLLGDSYLLTVFFL